jgi:PAS domain-containing protein
MSGDGGARTLRLVRPVENQQSAEWTWFCGHCAAPSPTGAAPVPFARVCGECGLGLLIETPVSAAPTPHDAFLVVDSALLVQAVSRRCERLLGVSEEQVIDRSVSELLVAADVDAQRPAALAEAVTDILASEEQDGQAFVRPWNTFGIRIRTRIAPCGPPRAALLVLDVPRALHLQAVEDDSPDAG